MEFTEHVRKPFKIEAIRLTKANIEEVGPLIGVVKYKKDGKPFVQVDQEIIPNMMVVWLGFWVTRIGDRYRCYSDRVFKDQYVKVNEDTQAWADLICGTHVPALNEVVHPHTADTVEVVNGAGETVATIEQ